MKNDEEFLWRTLYMSCLFLGGVLWLMGTYSTKITTIVKLYLLFNSAEKNLNSSSSFEILS